MEITALSTAGDSCIDNLSDIIAGFCDEPKIELLQEMPGGIPAMRWICSCLLPDLYLLYTAMCRRMSELPSIKQRGVVDSGDLFPRHLETQNSVVPKTLFRVVQICS